MGRRKNQTQINVCYKHQPQISKKKQIKNKKRMLNCFSTSNILSSTQIRGNVISKNVKKALRKLTSVGKEENNKRLLSALNIISERQIICSAMNIPSIQNLLTSRNQLLSCEISDPKMSQSGVSLLESMSYLVIQNQPELMLAYMCLVEKAIQKLGIVLSHNQNEKLLKGVWNLVVKYWSDELDEQNQYPDLSAKIEWGLLELLNFDLKVGKKQRIIMENKIKSLNNLQY